MKAIYRKRFLPELRRLRRGPLLRARPRPPAARARRDAGRPDDLRGHVAAGAACDRPRARRRPAARQHLGVAVPRRRETEREEMFATRARDNSCLIAFCNAVGGQDELIFDGHSLVLDERRPGRRAAPGFEEALLVVDVEPVEAVGRRLRDVRRARSPASAAPSRAAGRPDRLPAARRRGRSRRSSRRGSTSSSRCAWRSSSACATTCDKNGFADVVVGVSGGIDSALTAALAVEALGPKRVHLRLDAVALLVVRDAAGRAPARGEPRRRLPRASDRRGRDRGRGALAETFDGPRARPDRGEPPGARARAAPDGALEQVRLARRHDREQVGALGRLRDALRRHGRRLRAAQGRLQDGRLPPRGT